MITFSRYFLFTEANLAYIESLKDALDKVLDNKRVPAGPIRNWFDTQYIKWFKSSADDDKKPIQPHTYKEGEPEWMSREGIVDFTGFNDSYVQELNHLIDYFMTLDERGMSVLFKQPYSVVMDKVAEWDKTMLAKSQKPQSASSKLVEGTDYKVLFNTKDTNGKPMTWVHLLTKDAYKCEGDSMGHCVGGYDPSNKNNTILSLWDAQKDPHVTIEIQRKDIEQIKGKGNAAPADRYVPACVTFIKNLMTKGYTVTGDGGNIGMLEYKNKFYFSDSPEWEEIYTTLIVPAQEKVFAEIKKRIRTA